MQKQSSSLYFFGEWGKSLKKFDSKYMGHLLLEALYYDGKLNMGTYERVIESKKRYVQNQKITTKIRCASKAA